MHSNNSISHMFITHSQIQRVEEQDQIFALEISKAHVLELPIVDSCALECRSWLGDSRGPSGGA